MIVAAADFEHFLIDGRRARKEALSVKVVGGALELLRRALGIASLHVQVAKGVGGIPVARFVLDQPDIFLDGGGHLALLEKLLCLPECVVSIGGHSIDPIKQARLGLEGPAMQ